MTGTTNTFALKTKIDNYSIFKQLEVFIKIVECNSLSVAAQKLNLTPSAISRTLTKLEEQLGVMLLKRTTRNIILTDAGNYLYNQANNLLANLDKSLIKTASFYTHPHGQLKVTCSIAFGTLHLMRLFGEYKANHSEVSLSVDLNDQLVNLNEENFDIALRITATPPDNFALRKICPINWVYCASAQYLEQKGIPETIKDLDDYDCLINPNISHAWQFKDENNNVISVKGNNTILANSTLALVQAALTHQGIVYLPTYMLGEHLKAKELIPLFLPKYDKENTTYNLYALYCPSKYHDPKIRSFIDFLVDQFENDVFWDEWMQDY